MKRPEPPNEFNWDNVFDQIKERIQSYRNSMPVHSRPEYMELMIEPLFQRHYTKDSYQRDFLLWRAMKNMFNETQKDTLFNVEDAIHLLSKALHWAEWDYSIQRDPNKDFEWPNECAECGSPRHSCSYPKGTNTCVWSCNDCAYKQTFPYWES